MGRAIEVISGRVTNSNSVLTALTMNTGNTLQVRNAPFEKKVKLIGAWANFQVDGFFQIRSPRLHDNVRGLRFAVNALSPQNVLNPFFPQDLIPQDNLTVEVFSADAAGDVNNVAMLLYYEDLPGVNAKLVTPDFVLSHWVNLWTVDATLATTATGDWGGEETLIAESDLSKANTDYALIGFQINANCAAVRWRGSDLGNLGVGAPGNALHPEKNGRFFWDLSELTGLPCIPVFNSANRGAVLIDAAQDESGTDVEVTSIFVQLAP